MSKKRNAVKSGYKRGEAFDAAVIDITMKRFDCSYAQRGFGPQPAWASPSAIKKKRDALKKNKKNAGLFSLRYSHHSGKVTRFFVFFLILADASFSIAAVSAPVASVSL